MKPWGLLLILGTFTLWPELLAAPAEDPAGSSPLSQVGDTGRDQLREFPSTDKGSTLPRALKKDAEVLRKKATRGQSPVPQEQLGSKAAEMATSREGLASKDTLLSSGEAKPVPTEKPAGKESPRPEEGLGTPREGGSAGKPKPAEQPQLGSVGNLLLERKSGMGVGRGSDGEGLSSAVRSPGSAAEEPPSGTGHEAHEGPSPDLKPVPGGEPRTGEKPASQIGPALSKKPVLRQDPASSRETAGPSAGQTTPSKPISAGKSALSASHDAQSSPKSNEKPTLGGNPLCGGKTSSDPGRVTQEKPGPDLKPAPHERPGSGEKPAAAEKPQPEEKPEKDDDGEADKDTPDKDESKEEEEEEEEDDNNDDEEDRYEGGHSIFSNDKEKEDDFDRVLDYGLHKSPFNSDEYHDWWGGGDSKASDTLLSEEGGAADDEEPVFDVWGDRVEKGRESEARSSLPLAETGSEEGE